MRRSAPMHRVNLNYCIIDGLSSEPVGCVGITSYDDGSAGSPTKLICERGFRTIEVLHKFGFANHIQGVVDAGSRGCTASATVGATVIAAVIASATCTSVFVRVILTRAHAQRVLHQLIFHIYAYADACTRVLHIATPHAPVPAMMRARDFLAPALFAHIVRRKGAVLRLCAEVTLKA